MDNIKFSLVIPCYNEEKNIRLIINRLKRYLKKGYVEFILVDNGSKDNTRKEIEKYCKIYPSIKLVIIKKNIGYGNGILQGLKKAKGKYIGWTHADLQTDPIDFIKAIEIIKKENYPEKVYIKGKRYGRPIIDKIINTIGMSIFVTIMLKKCMYDINAQPTIFHKELMKNFKNPPLDFSFDLYVYYIAKKNNYKIIRFPVFFGKRVYGESSWNSGFKARIKFIKRTIKFTFDLKKRIKEDK